MPTTDAIPRPALILGWAGVIPFALLTAAVVLDIRLGLWTRSGGSRLRERASCRSSAASMGPPATPVWRGHSPFSRYLFSVLPSLLGFLCLLLPSQQV
jgi:hypothetical protein